MTDYQLAQFNAAPLVAPLDDPQVADFVAGLAEINALADKSPGFVWRLQGDSGDDSTDVRVDDNPLLLVNMSVWEDIESLYRYVYSTDHMDYFRRRRDWFTKWDKPNPVLWWVPAGEYPNTAEAMVRVNYMAEHGPTPYAFNFKQRFTAAEAAAHTPTNV